MVENMNEVENKVGQALEYLIAHDSPNLADYVINEGCYIAPIVLGRSRYSTTFEQYIVIDFTRPSFMTQKNGQIMVLFYLINLMI